jgi:hypothetical protein
VGTAEIIPSFECALAATELPRFGALLQRGAAVEVSAGRSVEAFLLGDLALDPRYVAERITTVFLDGRVVDRLDDALLHRGARLALSAAMPGLVGATLRRAGYYAAMRSAITHRPALAATAGGAELAEVKLFNLLIAELGPLLLARGVVVGREETEGLLAGAVAPGDLPPGERIALRVRLG